MGESHHPDKRGGMKRDVRVLQTLQNLSGQKILQVKPGSERSSRLRRKAGMERITQPLR